MKSLHTLLIVALVFAAAVPRAAAETSVSVDFFHDHLESYGDWREVGDYGYCWQPRDVDNNWRPYSDGRWLYTDAGWTWDSEEPYSWAVYHYGRWARVERVGWVWVPGTEWGPAWVSWRRSPRHVGWAPLPPDATFSRSVGFNTRVDADYDIGPTSYSFVEVRNFGVPRLRTVIVEPRENVTIIQQTTNITRITYVNNIVYNEGPQYEAISRESAQPIRRLKLERRQVFEGDPRTARAEQLQTRVEGDSLRVLALPLNARPASAPRKVGARVEKVEVDRGWKNAGPPADVAKLRTRIKSEPATPAEPVAPPKTGTTAEAPAGSPLPSSGPEEKPAKAPSKNGGQPTSPPAPVATEVAPAPPEKPVAPKRLAKPVNPANGTRPEKPEAGSARPVPSVAEEVEAPSQAKKGKDKSRTPQLPAEAPPATQVRVQPPERGNVEATRNPPAAEIEPPRQRIRPDNADARPKAEQPAVRSIERKVPNNPEPRPEAQRPEPREQPAPAVRKPQPVQPAQPAKEKGRGKSRDEEKEIGTVKPEGAPE